MTFARCVTKWRSRKDSITHKILVTNWRSLQGMPLVSSLLFLLSIHSAELCQVIEPIKQHELIGHVMKTMHETSFELCTYRCELELNCYSVNFHTKTNRCEFNYGSKEMFPQDFKESRDTLYIHNIRKDAKDPCSLLYCLHGGSCYPLPRPKCVCTADFTGLRCQNISKLKRGLVFYSFPTTQPSLEDHKLLFILIYFFSASDKWGHQSVYSTQTGHIGTLLFSALKCTSSLTLSSSDVRGNRSRRRWHNRRRSADFQHCTKRVRGMEGQTSR